MPLLAAFSLIRTHRCAETYCDNVCSEELRLITDEMCGLTRHVSSKVAWP